MRRTVHTNKLRFTDVEKLLLKVQLSYRSWEEEHFLGLQVDVFCSPPGCCCWALRSSALLLRPGTCSPDRTAFLVPKTILWR